MRRIMFGIRKSALARSQFDEFIGHLAKNKITLDYDVKLIVTQGDKDQKTPVVQMGQGIFTKEIEKALLSKEIDCAVHSLKDLPVRVNGHTELSCFLPRQDPRDCAVIRGDIGTNNMQGLCIGTGSPRRSAFLREIEPGIKILPIRGNVDTRIRKLDQGDYDVIVLAACGLNRLGFQNRIRRYFDPATFVPAAGQGIVCSQTRADDTELNNVLKKCSSLDTERASLAERKVLEALEVGCQMPFGVYARFDNENFIITAKLYVESNQTYISKRRTSPKSAWEKTTADLICDLKMKMGKA